MNKFKIGELVKKTEEDPFFPSGITLDTHYVVKAYGSIEDTIVVTNDEGDDRTYSQDWFVKAITDEDILEQIIAKL